MSNAKSYAYPLQEDMYTEKQRGLSKLELFAAMAMQGMLAGYGTEAAPSAIVAKLAIDHAKALLEELEKESK